MLIGSQHHLTSQANGHIKALLTPSKTDACQAQQMLVYEAKRLPLLQHIMFEKASVGPQTHDSSQRLLDFPGSTRGSTDYSLGSLPREETRGLTRAVTRPPCRPFRIHGLDRHVRWQVTVANAWQKPWLAIGIRQDALCVKVINKGRRSNLSF